MCCDDGDAEGRCKSTSIDDSLWNHKNCKSEIQHTELRSWGISCVNKIIVDYSDNDDIDDDDGDDDGGGGNG